MGTKIRCLILGKHNEYMAVLPNKGHILKCFLCTSILTFLIYFFGCVGSVLLGHYVDFSQSDCEFSDWVIGVCSATCGEGTRTNTARLCCDGVCTDATNEVTVDCDELEECPSKTIW